MIPAAHGQPVYVAAKTKHADRAVHGSIAFAAASPSVNRQYLSGFSSVNCCVFPDGQYTVTLPTFVSEPSPKMCRGSFVEAKLPPPLANRVCGGAAAPSKTMRAPTTSRFISPANSMPSQCRTYVGATFRRTVTG